MNAIQIETCDFAKTRKAAEAMTDAALAYSIADALESAKIADEFDKIGQPNNSGKYWDEYHTFCQVRTERIRKGQVVAKDYTDVYWIDGHKLSNAVRVF